MRDKIFRVVIGLLFLALVFLNAEYRIDNTLLKNKNWGLKLQNQIYKERLRECKKYPLFEQVISEVESRIYDLENYNCVDFSKDLVRKLEEIGIKSSIAVSEEREHAWVLVWIEATTGEFIRPGEDLGILELRDKEMKVNGE